MSWHALVLAATAGLVLFDCQNVLSRWRGRILTPLAAGSDDYTIVVPVYGHPRYFEGRAELAPLMDRILVALDVGNELMEEFASVLRAEGWRVVCTQVAVPTPPKLMKAVLPDVQTRFVVRMDADSRLLEDIGPHIAAMERDGADLASVKVTIDPAGLVTRIQALEYKMAMLSRHFRPWLTSGACFVARTASLRTILDLHTLNYLGEDVEMGRVALARKMRIRHLNISCVTDAPPTWGSLFNQRRLWWAGSFRHVVVNLDKTILKSPGWVVYYVALVYCAFYFKASSLELLVTQPLYFGEGFATILLVYVLVTVFANWQVRSLWMFVFPLYAFVQAMLMPIVGPVYYLVVSRRQGQFGRYRF